MKLRRSGIIAATILATWFLACGAKGGILRIVSYNIDCEDQSSDGNITNAMHSLPKVVQAIGLHHLGTNAQPMDVMSCEELNSTTLANFVAQLNAIYGAGTYTYDTTTDPNTGGGPDGIIYRVSTIQVVSARAIKTGQTVLLQSNGTYTTAHSPGGGINGVTRAPMVYLLRPIGYRTTNDFYMYVSHARSSSDNSVGDARYAEAQEVRSDAKYNLPAGSHILYGGDWNLFNGSGENAYKCLTGQTTSDGINWADTNLSVWANTNQTQGYDPMCKTIPPTTVTWNNTSSDNASYIYNDATEGSYAMTSRIDMQLPNALMYAAYNSKGGVQLAPDTSDPFDSSNFPSSKYPYAFETFGNNGSTPLNSSATSTSNHSLDDLTNATPNARLTYTNLVEAGTGSGSTFVGSDHYPIFGDYNIVIPQASSPPVGSFSAAPANGVVPLIVVFTNTGSGSITNCAWNFGDGATSNTTTAINVTHAYSNAGVYTVTETVTGPGGTNTLVATNYITVLTAFQGWQVQYFGSTNAPSAQPAVDADGTGQNNLFKYVAGLNPTNPASVFVFTIGGATNQPAAANLIFSPIVTGRTYTALFKTNLLTGMWTPLATGGVPVTNGSQVTITDTNATLPQGFYEIKISYP